MSKLIKKIGIIALYYVIPFAVSIPFVLLIMQKVDFVQKITKETPTMYYGFVDPLQFLVVIPLFWLIKKQKITRFCNFKKTSTSNLVIGLALGILSGMFTYSLINIGIFKTSFPKISDTIKYFILGGNAFLLIFVALINSLKKELFFRGLIFEELRGSMPITAAIIVQALLYGTQTLTVGVVVSFYGFAGALLFGIIYYFGGSIWVSILTQVFSTLSMLLIDRTFLAKLFTEQSAIPLFIFSNVASVVLFIVLYKNFKNKKSATSELTSQGVGV